MQRLAASSRCLIVGRGVHEPAISGFVDEFTNGLMSELWNLGSVNVRLVLADVITMGDNCILDGRLSSQCRRRKLCGWQLTTVTKHACARM